MFCIWLCISLIFCRWLKHNSLSYPQIAKLILLSRGKLESIRNRVEWLKTVRVKGDFIGDAMLKGGDNVVLRSDRELDEIVEYLESNGVRRDWMGYVLSRCPKLLSYGFEEVKTRVKFYLDMGLDEKDFGTMVFDFPKVLGYYSLEEMNQKVHPFLTNFIWSKSHFNISVLFFLIVYSSLVLCVLVIWNSNSLRSGNPAFTQARHQWLFYQDWMGKKKCIL